MQATQFVSSARRPKTQTSDARERDSPSGVGNALGLGTGSALLGTPWALTHFRIRVPRTRFSHVTMRGD